MPRRAPGRSAQVTSSREAELAARLAERERELAAARAQQDATADLLRVISQSPTDLRQVLERLASTAARLCGAWSAVVTRVEGDTLRHAASFPTAEAGQLDPEPFPIDRSR